MLLRTRNAASARRKRRRFAPCRMLSSESASAKNSSRAKKRCASMKRSEKARVEAEARIEEARLIKETQERIKKALPHKLIAMVGGAILFIAAIIAGLVIKKYIDEQNAEAATLLHSVRKRKSRRRSRSAICFERQQAAQKQLQDLAEQAVGNGRRSREEEARRGREAQAEAVERRWRRWQEEGQGDSKPEKPSGGGGDDIL